VLVLNWPVVPVSAMTGAILCVCMGGGGREEAIGMVGGNYTWGLELTVRVAIALTRGWSLPIVG
jgi:hypothetical protein